MLVGIVSPAISAIFRFCQPVLGKIRYMADNVPLSDIFNQRVITGPRPP